MNLEIILYKSYKEVIKIGNRGKRATTRYVRTQKSRLYILINIFLIMIKSCGDLPKV